MYPIFGCSKNSGAIAHLYDLQDLALKSSTNGEVCGVYPFYPLPGGFAQKMQYPYPHSIPKHPGNKHGCPHLMMYKQKSGLYGLGWSFRVLRYEFLGSWSLGHEG